MKRWMVLLALFATLLAACGTMASSATTNGTGSIGQPVAVPGGSYTNVSATKLQQMLASKDFALVNTHVPFEGDLPATDRSVPYNEIEQQLDQLPADKNAKIVVDLPYRAHERYRRPHIGATRLHQCVEFGRWDGSMGASGSAAGTLDCWATSNELPVCHLVEVGLSRLGDHSRQRIHSLMPWVRNF